MHSESHLAGLPAFFLLIQVLPERKRRIAEENNSMKMADLGLIIAGTPFWENRFIVHLMDLYHRPSGKQHYWDQSLKNDPLSNFSATPDKGQGYLLPYIRIQVKSIRCLMRKSKRNKLTHKAKATQSDTKRHTKRHGGCNAEKHLL
jgi:hypothetical protein